MELNAMGIPSQNELKRILGNFIQFDEGYRIEPLRIGYINDTYLVSDGVQPMFVLQRINDAVFKDVDGLMRNMDHALNHLSAKAYQKIELIPTASGKSHYKSVTGHWRLMTYLENSTTHNTTTSGPMAFEAGRIIGKFHRLLRPAALDAFVDTIPQFHSLDLRKAQFKKALSQTDENRASFAKDTILLAKDLLKKLDVFDFSPLPLRICHNDTKLNNILFSKKTGKALCLIDLDTIMPGYFLYDFGDAVRTIVNTAPEDESNLDKITFKKPLFEAFVKGLASEGSFLAEKEIRSLPTGAVLMPFLHGLRALTDYLNNNIYYKVAYETQNLDRAVSLFDVAQKARTNMGFMQETTSAILTSLESD